MRKDFFRKGLVLGVIILFVGAGVIPSICSQPLKNLNGNGTSFLCENDVGKQQNPVSNIWSFFLCSIKIEFYLQTNSQWINSPTGRVLFLHAAAGSGGMDVDIARVQIQSFTGKSLDIVYNQYHCEVFLFLFSGDITLTPGTDFDGGIIEGNCLYARGSGV